MIKILFICHGNICRSPAAEFVFGYLAAREGLTAEADSAAVSYEEIGNPVYPPMKRELIRRGIPMKSHAARRTEKSDYDRYDLIIGMDWSNIGGLNRIYGGDPKGKIRLLMSFAGEDQEVSDPWYTRDFEKAVDDILRGCRGLVRQLKEKNS